MRKSLAALKNVYFKAEKIGHKFEKLGHKFLVSKVIKGHKWSRAESADTLKASFPRLSSRLYSSPSKYLAI